MSSKAKSEAEKRVEERKDIVSTAIIGAIFLLISLTFLFLQGSEVEAMIESALGRDTDFFSGFVAFTVAALASVLRIVVIRHRRRKREEV
jgi:multisubunit Na+/H+ antiporter MnhB subunit